MWSSSAGSYGGRGRLRHQTLSVYAVYKPALCWSEYEPVRKACLTFIKSCGIDVDVVALYSDMGNCMLVSYVKSDGFAEHSNTETLKR